MPKLANEQRDQRCALIGASRLVHQLCNIPLTEYFPLSSNDPSMIAGPSARGPAAPPRSTCCEGVRVGAAIAYLYGVARGIDAATDDTYPLSTHSCMDGGQPMRLPKTAHTSRPWRIHELTYDFRLEDVWALPTPGGPDDFPRLVQLIASRDPSQGSSCVARALWAIRWKIGELLGWDGPDAGLGSRVPTLRDRLPADLREAPSSPDADTLPFTSLYLLDDEWAAEIANRTVHGVMHVGWVPDQMGGYRGQMAVYVKPNGPFGTAYIAAIMPFRHLIVYPPMMRDLGRDWRALAGDPTPGHD